jgi:hypothetical protein
MPVISQKVGGGVRVYEKASAENQVTQLTESIVSMSSVNEDLR